jgi:hypothetical protein
MRRAFAVATLALTLGAGQLPPSAERCFAADAAAPDSIAADPAPLAAAATTVETPPGRDRAADVPGDVAALGSPAVEVHARAEPDTTTIGSKLRYTMEVVALPGVQVVLAQPTERIGIFDIVDFGDPPPATRDGKTVITRWYDLTGWEVGHHFIESPPVRYRRADAADLADTPGERIVVTIESVLAKAGSPSDIRDVKPPEEPPFYWRPYVIVAGGVALLLFTVALAWRLLSGRSRVRPAPPPRPAHEIAIDDLERLRARRLTDHGLFKEYYSALSDIVRAYLERRFHLRAPEMTTEEFLVMSARGGRLQSTHRALLGGFLRESDLVKFARHVPTIADSERAFAAARRFVDETAAERDGSDGDAAPPAGTGAARNARRARQTPAETSAGTAEGDALR